MNDCGVGDRMRLWIAEGKKRGWQRVRSMFGRKNGWLIVESVGLMTKSNRCGS